LFHSQLSPVIKALLPFRHDGNQIAFSWNGVSGDNTDIYVNLIDAGEPLRLTTNPADDFSPAWSPDGRTSHFRASRSEKGIYSFCSGRHLERKLYLPDWDMGFQASVAWAGWKYLGIAWTESSPETPFGIWLLCVETLERRQLTSPPQQNVMDGGPSFSPRWSNPRSA